MFRSSSQRRGRLAAVVGLVAAALAIELALAGGSGLRYASDSGTVASGTNRAAARCPVSTTVVGGGVGVADDGPDTEINATATSPGGGGWTVWINNSTSADVGFVVHAICAESGQYEQVRKSRRIAPDTTELDQVRCPARTKVTGGGVDTNTPENDVEIVSSFPLDTADSNERPEDGWRGKVNNELDVEAQMTVVAICADRGRYGYVSSVRDLPVDTEKRVRANCGTDKVTGGGVSIQGLDFGFEASNSFPQDRGDGDERPDDGWVAGGNNEGELGHDTELRAWAICKRT